MYRIFESGSNRLLHEEKKLDKAKRYAELYKKNFNTDCTIQHCQEVWSTSSNVLNQIVTKA